MSNKQIIKLDEYWPYQVVVLADLIAKNTSTVLKANGDLNLSQWRGLAAVAEKEGRSAAEVVAVTPMDKGIVSRATASLVEDGLIKKENDKDDKRRSLLFMTKSGKQTYSMILKDLLDQTNSIEVSGKMNSHLLEVIAGMKKL